MTISPLVFIFSAVAAILVFEAVRHFVDTQFVSDQARSARRLRRLAERARGSDDEEENSLLRSAGSDSPIDRFIEELPGARRLALELYRAGLAMSLTRFAVISLALAVLGHLGAAAFSTAPLFQAAGAGLGLLPWLNARRLARKRTATFEEQFPNALDLLIRSLRAGHSLSVGLQMVAEELPDPVGPEFGLVADEIRLGKTVPAALSNLAHRIDAPDLPFFMVAVAIQQETGSNLAEVLQNLSDVIRERFQLYGKVRALTSMGRASANLLACWPAVMVGSLYMVNPGYIQPLWETEEGHTMMLISTIMIVIGYIVCRRMAVIRV